MLASFFVDAVYVSSMFNALLPSFAFSYYYFEKDMIVASNISAFPLINGLTNSNINDS